MARLDAERIRFLFRTDQGRIDCATWRRGAGALAAVLLTFTAPWVALRPHIVHDLSQRPLFAPEIFAAYAYALLYAFAVIFIGVSYMNLSAKRFRALGWRSPLGLAGIVPLAALLTGALHLAPVLSPAGVDIVPQWANWLADAAFVVVLLWTIAELGFNPSEGVHE